MSFPLRQETLMRWILFAVFLIVFVAVVTGTLGALFFGFGHLTEYERDVLFTSFIVEIGAAVVALFYSIFGLRRSKKAPTRLRLDLDEFSDVQTLIGRTAVLSPSKADGRSLSDVNIKIMNDNGPYLPLDLPQIADNVYVTIDAGQKCYAGSFVVGTYRVELSEEG